MKAKRLPKTKNWLLVYRSGNELGNITIKRKKATTLLSEYDIKDALERTDRKEAVILNVIPMGGDE